MNARIKSAPRWLARSAEALEVRSLLSAINVTTTDDVVDGDVASLAALQAAPGSDGFISLREAILAANATAGADTINVPAGAFTLTIAGQDEGLGATGDLDVTDDLTIAGESSSTTILQAGASAAAGIDRVLHAHSLASLSLSALAIRHGNPGNTANDGSDDGGGLLVSGGDVTLRHVSVIDNIAFGGGLAIGASGTSSAILIESTVSDNLAAGSGGGIFNAGTLTIVGSTINDNHAGVDGGGVYGPINLTNSTISANTANRHGGGLAVSGSAVLRNATVVKNVADFDENTTGLGGGIIAIDSTSAGTKTFASTIVAGNFAGSSSSDLAVLPGESFNFLSSTTRHNLIGDAATSAGLTNGVDGNIVGVSLSSVLSPLLSANGGPTLTHALVPGSPVIDAGTGNSSLLPVDTFDLDGDSNTTEVAPFDQRGFNFARINGSRIDIGAFEATSGTSVVGMKFNDANGNGFRDQAHVELAWTTVASVLDTSRPLFPNINGGLSFPYTVVNGGGGVVTYFDGLPASDAVVLADGDVTFAFGQSAAPYTGTPALTLESFDNGSTTGLAIQRFRPESGVTNNTFTIFNAGVAVVTGTLDSVDVFTYPVGNGLDSFANAMIQLTGVPGGADPTIYNELLTATGGSGTLFVNLSTFDFEGEAAALDDGSIFLSQGGIEGLTSVSEVGLSGWTIYVDLDRDGTLGAGEPSAVTDAGGHYLINNVAAGSRLVREEAQAG